MAPEIDLSKLTVAEKDALILSLLPLVSQLQAALARIAELEARLALLERPPKTPDNSSLPPSKGQKTSQPPDGRKPPRKSRPGFGRMLEPNPDRTVDRLLDTCPHCATTWPTEPQMPQQVYDRIELPPVRPDVTRVRLFGGRCSCCGERAVASAPPGLEPGSPFGKSIEAVAIYLHYSQAIGIERLRLVFGELFGLSISEGAICNILARAQAPLDVAASAIATLVTAADVVASDETSVRVMKKTCWEWVFVTAACVLHIIRPSRGARVVRELFGQMRPRVWISDSLASQRGHAELWQVCLAHLLRDAQYSIDCGDDGFAAAFKRLLLRAIAIGRRRDRLRDTTLVQYHADLDRRLDRVLSLPRHGDAAEKLRRRIARDREHLFVFVTDRDVAATNNACERALRPSVIFRKVTNGFRSEWGAQTYAAFRSVVSTAKLNNRSVLDDLRRVLATPLSNQATQPG
ncbi:IS66 family transposase [Acidisoma silvae]|uniref:IS66 family transposase n=1 Tax=Acidisoma silvae TaxID=2802396 RepID=UPI001D0A84C4|nr:IS66 family transposase [Acidisoma silvae]